LCDENSKLSEEIAALNKEVSCLESELLA